MSLFLKLLLCSVIISVTSWLAVLGLQENNQRDTEIYKMTFKIATYSVLSIPTIAILWILVA